MKYYVHIGGDEISYINIAHAYATGEWRTAINGYWSPFYSWLMIPFLSFGSSPIYAVYVSKILSITIGFLTILGIRHLLNVFNITNIVRMAALLSLVPIILYFALTYATPDLLLTCILIFYLSIILSPKYSNNNINGILCGFIGAVAYLTKSYAFPFFVVHFLLFNLIYYFKGINSAKKNKILKNLVLGAVVFLFVSGFWIGAISEKYGKLTISTAGEHNQAFMGPEYSAHPVFYTGLYKPPNNSSTSIWDDPSYIKMVHWSPFDSVDSFNYQLKRIWKNIIYTTVIIESFFHVAFLILISIIVFILRYAKKCVKDKFIYLLITMGIYISGYLLIIPEWRYLWPIFILLVVSAFYLVDILFKNRSINRIFRNILLIILIFSVTAEPIYETVLFSDASNSIYDLSNILKNEYGIQGNIASNEWGGKSLIISYYLGAKYYGKTKSKNSIDLMKELDENNIDYYFLWNGEEYFRLSGYKEITEGKIIGLKIYSRIENK